MKTMILEFKSLLNRTNLVASLAGAFVTTASVGLLLASGQADAGIRDVGNGGSGIERAGHVYLLDLMEAGVEQQPFFAVQPRARAAVTRRLQKALINVPQAPAQLVSQKLGELAQYDDGLPEMLVQVIEMLSWKSVDMDLSPIHDANTVLAVSTDARVQIAARSEQSIKIDAHLWMKMDEGNRAALILHEAIYTLIKSQSSDDAREVVGAMFLPDFQNIQSTRFITLVYGKLPTIGHKAIAALSLFDSDARGVAYDPTIDVHPTGPTPPNIAARLRANGDSTPWNNHQLYLDASPMIDLSATVASFCQIAAPAQLVAFQSQNRCSLKFSGDAVLFDCDELDRQETSFRGIYNESTAECVQFLTPSMQSIVDQLRQEFKRF